jgi:response regulator RpfG family c-di-GMP phosphodiesterase
MNDKKILFVDDEEDVLNSLKRQFRKDDFKMYIALGGEEALRILSEMKIHIIISDERMPGMSGIELLHKVKKLYPETIRIILSGYADTNSIINAINKGEVYRFVSKPWSKESLLQVIDESFAQIEVNENTKKYMEKIIEENRKLQKQLDSRNSALEITIEILNKISRPIIAISDEERIVKYNNEAKNICKDSIEEGAYLKEHFSDPIREKIMEGLEIPGGRKSFKIDIEGKKITIYTRALRSQDPYKGLVFFEI